MMPIPVFLHSLFILPPSSFIPSSLILFLSTPTRIRTRNPKLEAWDDSPFHHRGGRPDTLVWQRKARESNPHLRSGEPP